MKKVNLYPMRPRSTWQRIELDAMPVKRTSVLNVVKNPTTSVKPVTRKMRLSVGSAENNSKSHPRV